MSKWLEDKDLLKAYNEYLAEHSKPPTNKYLADKFYVHTSTVSARLKKLDLTFTRRPSNSLTDEVRKYLLNNYKTKNITQMASELNLHNITIRNHLKTLGIYDEDLVSTLSMKRSNFLSKEDLVLAYDDYVKTKGTPVDAEQLADSLGFSTSTVKSMLKDLGLSYLKRRGGRKPSKKIIEDSKDTNRGIDKKTDQKLILKDLTKMETNSPRPRFNGSLDFRK